MAFILFRYIHDRRILEDSQFLLHTCGAADFSRHGPLEDSVSDSQNNFQRSLQSRKVHLERVSDISCLLETFARSMHLLLIRSFSGIGLSCLSVQSFLMSSTHDDRTS